GRRVRSRHSARRSWSASRSPVQRGTPAVSSLLRVLPRVRGDRWGCLTASGPTHLRAQGRQLDYDLDTRWTGPLPLYLRTPHFHSRGERSSWQTHLPGGHKERRTWETLRARRVRCRAWFGPPGTELRHCCCDDRRSHLVRRVSPGPLASRATRREGGIQALGVGKPSIRIFGQTAEDHGLQV